jgi:GNAT superfamily N-acetyltransferase
VAHTNDDIATAAGDVLLQLSETVEGAWALRSSGLVAGATGIPVPNLNGVLVESLAARVEDAVPFLDRIRDQGLPYYLQVRPGADPGFRQLATERGMVLEEQIPLMVLADGHELAPIGPVDGLTVRQLDPEEAGLHVQVAAAGFGAPSEVFAPLATPATLRTPGVRCYIGEADGVAVTTGLGVTIGDLVAVFNIATPEEHRGRGYGAAVTAAVVQDGLSHGATGAWLQSSEAGYGIYQRLGFTTVERWVCWVTGE